MRGVEARRAVRSALRILNVFCVPAANGADSASGISPAGRSQGRFLQSLQIGSAIASNANSGGGCATSLRRTERFSTRPVPSGPRKMRSGLDPALEVALTPLASRHQERRAPTRTAAAA